MIRSRRLLIGLLVPFFAVLSAQLLAQRCGVERWAIKTGTDAGASQLDLQHPKNATIADLIALSAPKPLPTTRVTPTETTVFAIDLWDIAGMAVETAGRTVAPTNSMSEATPVSRAIVFSCLVRSCMSAFRLHRWRNSTSGSQGAGRPVVELYRRFVLYRARNAVNHLKRPIAIIGRARVGDCSEAQKVRGL